VEHVGHGLDQHGEHKPGPFESTLLFFVSGGRTDDNTWNELIWTCETSLKNTTHYTCTTSAFQITLHYLPIGFKCYHFGF
jgi:hypothetical protein